jgi:hypothetical protein
MKIVHNMQEMIPKSLNICRDKITLISYYYYGNYANIALCHGG